MAKIKVTKKRIADGRALQQVAALPYRATASGEIEVLVLTSRETQRVIIPKGWPIKGRRDWKAAQIEARQEAGVIGEIGRKRLGQYKYWKRLDTVFVLVKVNVYALNVTRQLDDWPEKHERAQRWLSPEQAATLIDETDLGTLVTSFAQTAKTNGRPRRKASPARRAEAVA